MGKLLKRAIDVFGAAAGLLLLWPLMLLTAALVALIDRSPVLFRQRRIGLSGKPFTILKFRTMREGEGPDADRLTGLGRFLRRWSLDELPQLWHVLKGEMSLVGPRPLLPEYMDRYTPEQARRHAVRPGMTGWAQVSGRNAQTWDERLALDVWYVDNLGLRVDTKILLLTMVKVIRGEGVSARGYATMPELKGPETADE